MSKELQINKIEAALITNDLSRLSEQERLAYYKNTCESLGLNHLTNPFGYIPLNGKLCLYAKKDATDQLRKLHSVSVIITTRMKEDGIYSVTARAKLPDGREDESIGAVNIMNLKGDSLANAIMKAETKAKRRATLSICGLGFLDETETETIPESAKQLQHEKVINEVQKISENVAAKEHNHETAKPNNQKENQSNQNNNNSKKTIKDFNHVPLPPKPIENHAIIPDTLDFRSYKTNFRMGSFDYGSTFENLGHDNAKKLYEMVAMYGIKCSETGTPFPDSLDLYMKMFRSFDEFIKST